MTRARRPAGPRSAPRWPGRARQWRDRAMRREAAGPQLRWTCTSRERMAWCSFGRRGVIARTLPVATRTRRTRRTRCLCDRHERAAAGASDQGVPVNAGKRRGGPEGSGGSAWGPAPLLVAPDPPARGRTRRFLAAAPRRRQRAPSPKRGGGQRARTPTRPATTAPDATRREHVQLDRSRSGLRSRSRSLVDRATCLMWTRPRRGPVHMRFL